MFLIFQSISVEILIFYIILKRWGDFLVERKKGNKSKGWDYYIKPYVPKYYAKIINAQGTAMTEQSKSNPYYNQFDALKNENYKQTSDKTQKILNNSEKPKNELNKEEKKNNDLEKNKQISQQILSSVKPNEEKLDDKKKKPKILKNLNLNAVEYKPKQ